MHPPLVSVNDWCLATCRGMDGGLRWGLIVSAAMVQVVAGGVYSMGAWQAPLRDALGLSTEAIALVGATTFMGSMAAMLGGRAFDSLGPKTTVLLGGSLATCGYSLIGLPLVFTGMPSALKLILAAAGSLAAGYSSVSLLDNVVCMSCSLSFPEDRAGIVGYLKAVLATAAGMWATLWTHVFAPMASRGAPGLLFYLALMAGSTLLVSLGASANVGVLPVGPSRRPLGPADKRRLGAAIEFVRVPFHVYPWRRATQRARVVLSVIAGQRGPYCLLVR